MSIDLDKELDKTKSSVFLNNNAAFLGSIMCSMRFVWDTSVPTAATDGVTLFWNPDWFTSLKPNTRKSVLMHELWHVARLHNIRGESFDPEDWNIACDIRINNDLAKEGYTFEGVDPQLDHSYDVNGIVAEEDIYTILRTKPKAKPTGFGSGDLDLLPTESKKKQEVIDAVVRAIQQAKQSNQQRGIPGGIETLLSTFLDPVIPWQTVLMKFFTDAEEYISNWSRPSRRYRDIYMPSSKLDDGRLKHLMYFLDVSGSISNADVHRFNSEVKHVQETLCPKKLTLVQFDTVITSVSEFTEFDSFSEIKVVGRGGTSLVPVRNYILEHKPSAAIVFSDLFCEPMKQLSEGTPIIWIVVGNKNAKVSFGKVLHI